MSHSQTPVKTRLQCIQESADIKAFLGHAPPFATAGYDAENTEWDFVRILIIGAGGIGCELLHLLALSGFGHLTIVDLDTIELSNLNRQFLFREEDIGQPKSHVAARRVMERCPGITVEGIFGRIEDQSDDFYRSFHLIVMGLDSVPARRWMNRKVADLATWEVVKDDHQDGSSQPAMLRITEAIPILETGTEGLQGHVKFIDMANRSSSCLECMMWMYGNKRRQVPMCSLENIPRLPEHCVLYVQFKEWPEAHSAMGETLDGDNVAHIRWVTERARERQQRFGIGGTPIDETFTLGVVKNVVPAVSSTNAMVAGMAVTEVMKWLTGVAPTLNNYYLYDGAGVSTEVMMPGSQPLGAAPDCPVCGPRPLLPVRLDTTPAQLREALVRASPSLLEDAAVAAREGTLSLRFREPLASGEEAATHEVFLVFKAGSPYAVPITGNTVGEILESSGPAAQRLLGRWKHGSAEAAALSVSAMLTASGGVALVVPIQCE